MLDSSSLAWSKGAHARSMFDLMSDGASLLILMQPCSSDSGMFFWYENPGGSAFT